MPKVSVFVPSRNERFLQQTVADLLSKARGDIEVIAVLDGYWADPPLPDDPRLRVLHFGEPRGLRAGVNGAAAIATGDYYLKCDGHCLFGEGYDVTLAADHAERNWIVIPRRKRLDAENWRVEDPDRTPLDIHYLSCPQTSTDGYSMHGVFWAQRTVERLHEPISETMSFQGSCWFMHRSHFHDFLGGMSEAGYGTFSQEPQEIGNKTWLGGGAVMVNKNTYYAHLHKGKRYGRGYFQSKGEVVRGHEYAGQYWMSNAWEQRVHDIDWLIDKFYPVPTWRDDWKEHRFEAHRPMP